MARSPPGAGDAGALWRGGAPCTGPQGLHWAPDPGEPVCGPTAPREKLPHRLSITQQAHAQTGPSRRSRAGKPCGPPDRHRAEGTRGAFLSCPVTCRGAPEPAAQCTAAGPGRRGGLGAATWGRSSVSERLSRPLPLGLVVSLHVSRTSRTLGFQTKSSSVSTLAADKRLFRSTE